MKNKDPYFILFMFITVIAAIYYRVAGLGLWGFTSADEYYMAKSVQSIFKYGLPKFDTGGYYTRGIFYQYLSAGFIWIGLKDVFALRLVAVLANISAMPVVFLIANKLGGKKVAIISLFLFVFSSWEVEYARFSRYYTLFQTIFLWHLYFLYKVIIENENRHYKWALILGFLSIFTYEGGIFLVVLNFLPFVFRNKKIDKTILFWAIIVLLISVLYIKTDFRQLGVTNQLPPNLILPEVKNGGMIYFPPLLIKTFKNLNFWFIGISVLSFITIILFFRFLKKIKIQTIFSIAIIIGSLILNQYTLAFIFTIIFYILKWINIYEFNKANKIIVFVLIFSLLFWMSYLYLSKDWYLFYKELNSLNLKSIFWIFLDYPDIYQQIFLPWFKPLPITSIILFSVTIIYFCKVLFDDIKLNKFSEKDNYYLLSLILLLLITGVSAIVTPYHVGRYSFFIHPLILVIFSYSLSKLLQLFSKNSISTSLYILIIILTMFFSKDYSFEHFINVSSEKEHFKEGYSKAQATMYYLREDYKTVAEFVNTNSKEEDIILLTVAPAEYYLNKVDYYYRDYRDIEFPIRSRNKGKKELWTNADLIYNENELLNFIQNFNGKGNLWLITYSPYRLYRKGLKVTLYENYKNNIAYKNLNNTILVYKF